MVQSRMYELQIASDDVQCGNQFESNSTLIAAGECGDVLHPCYTSLTFSIRKDTATMM